MTEPEDVGRLMRRIEDEAARMGLLVEDLLLLARLDRERPLALSRVQLPVIAGDAVHAARAVDPDRPIELEVHAGGRPLVVWGDDARLRQVVGNLLSNALTHTPPGTRVVVRLRTEPGHDTPVAVLEVADEGPGWRRSRPSGYSNGSTGSTPPVPGRPVRRSRTPGAGAARAAPASG